MGICLSCLRPQVDDDELNERSSLLGHRQSTDENLQEELIKQQQRQAELFGIVNELSDNLIDVPTFLTLHTIQEPLEGPETAAGSAEDETRRQSLKQQIMREVADLNEATKESCRVSLSGQLYLEFKGPTNTTLLLDR